MNHSTQLDALLLNAIGLSNAGTNLLGSSRDNLVGAADILAPTTSLLFKYNPEYTCFLQGAKWYLDNGGYAAWGGADGRTLQLDVALLFGNDPYVYPDNLPVVAAKGVPAEGRDAGHCRMPPTTSRCASWSPTPDGEPGWTSGPTPASGIPAGPTTSR